MFEKLQTKWKVSGWRLLLILVTFALGGSLCGYLGRKILGLLTIDKALWVVLYIVLITLLWPICVLFISIPLGQFRFFRNYLKRIAARMFGRKKMAQKKESKLNIAVFASGAGTNAAKLMSFFNTETAGGKVSLVLTNNAAAGVLGLAEHAGVPSVVIDLKNKSGDALSAAYLDILKLHQIDFIVLAGYLKKIPSAVILAYPSKIVNIHPALLPLHGGPGMYGSRVHEAVIVAGEKESGISIHYVDEIYDHGKIILQQRCAVTANETPETLAKKIHALEHEWYGKTIKDILAAV